MDLVNLGVNVIAFEKKLMSIFIFSPLRMKYYNI